MYCQSLEKRLAMHCAPTLRGAKAASLLSLSRQEFPELPLQLRRYNIDLYQTGLRFIILREQDDRCLVLVYRPTMLRNNLNTPEVRSLLDEFSYPATSCLGAQLRHLKHRFTQSGGFPHEIGLFLDYPPDDVAAFISGATECKLCGYWKVYCNVNAAKEKFACYDACRACVCRMLAAGCTISELLCAA